MIPFPQMKRNGSMPEIKKYIEGIIPIFSKMSCHQYLNKVPERQKKALD